MDSKKARFMISLSMKAGRIAAGSFAAENAVRTGKAALILVSQDASANTKKKFHDMAAYRHIPIHEFLTKEELGALIGKGERSSVVITDPGLAREIHRLFEADVQE
ncbi:MAG: ribosomal L7Ae/L30e/S12e/Gadd45 family protein [Eubacterium sp.]|nr:ribosomal L7Ae/L30e/S12e/Gadd45 family protein [Eubacterium sp.]